MIQRMQKSMKDKDQGFTLIELLVVIVIIGILAAIAIPIFLNQRKKAVDAGLKSDVKTAATNIETWMVDNQAWTAAAGADVVSIATDLKVTTGNAITFYKASTAAGGYCLKGHNDGGSGTDWYYSSQLGGLTKTAC